MTSAGPYANYLHVIKGIFDYRIQFWIHRESRFRFTWQTECPFSSKQTTLVMMSLLFVYVVFGPILHNQAAVCLQQLLL